MSPRSIHNLYLVSGQLQKTLNLDKLLTSARDLVLWYWSANTLYWQVSIDHNMNGQNQRSTYKPRVQIYLNLFAEVWPQSCAALSPRSCVRAHEQSVPLAMMTMEKSVHGFPLFSYIHKGPLLAFGSPELRYKNISFVCRFYYITSRSMLITVLVGLLYM